MTFQGIYDLAKVMYDEARSPSEQEAKFAIRYENSRLAWQEWYFRNFEISEDARAHLRPFLRVKQVEEKDIIYHKDIPEFRFNTGITGEFIFGCSGKTTKRTIPISPRKIHHAIASLSDAWANPDDADPVFFESGDKEKGSFFQILSTNVPKKVNIYYVKYPKKFDIIDNPNGVPEEEDGSVKEIINFLLKSREYTFENFNRFKAIDSI